VFCATQDHAALVRDLINQVKSSTGPALLPPRDRQRWRRGRAAPSDFQDNDKTIPTILTTSQKLSTGVDARNIRHIVLMRPIRSMIEFKQIIGRGTRTLRRQGLLHDLGLREGARELQRPEWDGEPLEPEWETHVSSGVPRAALR
jgi:type I restriction enzyme R subunit